jgi:hypothetical protein
MQFWARAHIVRVKALLSYPGWWGTVLMVDLAIVALVLAIALVILTVIGVMSVGKSSPTPAKISERLSSWYKPLSDRLDARYQRKLQELVCEGSIRVVSYKAIPKDKRTNRLRWAWVKKKVCKPFAQ